MHSNKFLDFVNSDLAKLIPERIIKKSSSHSSANFDAKLSPKLKKTYCLSACKKVRYI